VLGYKHAIFKQNISCALFFNL